MPEHQDTESVRFTQIAGASTGGEGAALHGLTADGRVYLWSVEQALWLPLPMLTPTAEDSSTGFRMMTADEMQLE